MPIHRSLRLWNYSSTTLVHLFCAPLPTRSHPTNAYTPTNMQCKHLTTPTTPHSHVLAKDDGTGAGKSSLVIISITLTIAIEQYNDVPQQSTPPSYAFQLRSLPPQRVSTINDANASFSHTTQTPNVLPLTAHAFSTSHIPLTSIPFSRVQVRR